MKQQQGPLMVYIQDLWDRAFKCAPFDTLCTILRVEGMSDSKWDPFEESLDTFADLKWLIQQSGERGKRCALRLTLLSYCHALEMSAIHHLLISLLYCLSNKPYTIRPFTGGRSKKDGLLGWIPPSAKTKYRQIKELATTIGENQLVNIIDGFFNDDVRNAVFHSDYILTEEEFRFTEQGPAKKIHLSELNGVMSNCFEFYDAVIGAHSQYKAMLGKMQPFHQWPNHQVLELLCDDTGDICGFSVHFSNGSKSTFSRSAKGTVCSNIFFRDNQIGFDCGNLAALVPIWKIDGEAVIDWAWVNSRQMRHA